MLDDIIVQQQVGCDRSVLITLGHSSIGPAARDHI